jgi:hypothetical protein
VQQPQPQEELDMIILRTKIGADPVTYTYDGTSVTHIVSDADQNALAAVLKVVDVTEAQLIKCNGGALPPM